jgi:hypothetical protein
MFKKLSTLVMAGVIFVSLLGFTGGSVALAATAGSGPESALAPAGHWMPLAVGQETWYSFNYAGDGSQILARMGVSPADSATFSVWTPANVQQRAQGATVTPIGQGAANNAFGGDLVWTGNFNVPGTYYIVVDQAGSTPGYYALTVSGSGVYLPQTKQVKAPASGTKPMAPTGNAAALAAGQQHWYTFDYAGDNSEILARMSVNPTGSSEFSVWTPALFQQLGQAGPGDKVDPVGRGSVDNGLGGDLVWQGKFDAPGTYHILVDQTGSVPGTYALNVTGNGVTIPTPAKLAAIKAPTATAAKAVTPSVTPAKPTTTAKPAAAAVGSSPNNPAPLDTWEALGVGQQKWYSFQYPGDKSQVTLAMVVDPAGTAGFQVLTPAQFQQYQQDGTITAVGQGSVDNSINADLVWSGNFDIPGTYYVLVSQIGSTPSNYMLAFH